MVNARKEESWDHTAHIICYQVNTQTAKGRKYKPEEFTPYGKQQAARRSSLNKEQTVRRLNQFFGVTE